jgi:hypothetical protein
LLSTTTEGALEDVELDRTTAAASHRKPYAYNINPSLPWGGCAFDLAPFLLSGTCTSGDSAGAMGDVEKAPIRRPVVTGSFELRQEVVDGSELFLPPY